MSSRTVIAATLLSLAIGSAYAATDTVSTSATGQSLHATNTGNCAVTRDESRDTGVCAHSAVAASTPSSLTVSPLLAREERMIYFRFNQAALSPNNQKPSDAQERLDDLIAMVGSASHVQGVRIIGYADRIGDAHYNETLSRKRAESVKNYLVAKGVLNARVADIRWVGPQTQTMAPTAECSDTSARSELIDCLQQDRRVEIQIDYTPDLRASR